MNRNSVLKIVNPILVVLLVNQVFSGRFGRALPHEAFVVLHKAGGFVLAVAVVAHVALNWAWVRNNFFRRARGAKPQGPAASAQPTEPH